MLKCLLLVGVTVLLLRPFPLRAANGEVVLRTAGPLLQIKVEGDKDDDWWLQSSTNLPQWTTLTNFGTLLSGNATNAPWRTLGYASNAVTFYRSRQTAGLFDPSVFRTISLTFTQANWTNALADARTGETNAYCSMLTLDNGATNYSVGARYKGNGSYTDSGTKKPINLELDYIITNADLMNYSTLNLNNAYGDETIMREPLYFSVMKEYAPCPKASMARVHVNGSLWGVYSFVQQENNQLIDEWFPSKNGDRWRTPNVPVGGFSSSNSALYYFGNSNINSYVAHYELRTDNVATNIAWQRLINAIYVLGTTPTNVLRDKLEDVFALDSWLWFLAIENVFVDDDSYWNKGANYGFYYEPESGRLHPVERDGNEAYASIGSVNYSLSPVQGAATNSRPLLFRSLALNELRQRYLAHMRTVLQEYFNPVSMSAMINGFHSLSVKAILDDPNKGFSMTAYTNDLVGLKTYVTNRYNYLLSHPELSPLPPNIDAVAGPSGPVYATNRPYLTARVTSNGNSGVGTVWLYHRGKPYGRFAQVQMFDDGAHGDGAAGDRVFGAACTNYPVGSVVQFYVEARATNAAQAARLAPERAERQTYSYRVAFASATGSPVVINEFMADNIAVYKDPQGQYDDWIELYNFTDQSVNLGGRYLSDDFLNLRKWQFPPNTTISARDYLIVWADEDTNATPGLHASFKLSKSGEQIILTDSDANSNAVMDSVVFGAQQSNLSYGRSSTNADVWSIQTPSPKAPNY